MDEGGDKVGRSVSAAWLSLAEFRTCLGIGTVLYGRLVFGRRNADILSMGCSILAIGFGVIDEVD